MIIFDKNILTFNPGWDSNAQELDTFTDVRELQRKLKTQGVQLVNEADESTMGPASFIAVDPDGNPDSRRSTCLRRAWSRSHYPNDRRGH
jgi:hypothetical protein